MFSLTHCIDSLQCFSFMRINFWPRGKIAKKRVLDVEMSTQITRCTQWQCVASTINLFTTQLKRLQRLFFVIWHLGNGNYFVCQLKYVIFVMWKIYFLSKFPNVSVTSNKPNICEKSKKYLNWQMSPPVNSGPSHFLIDSKENEMNCVSNVLFCHVVAKSTMDLFLKWFDDWNYKIDSSKSNGVVNIRVDMCWLGLNKLMLLNKLSLWDYDNFRKHIRCGTYRLFISLFFTAVAVAECWCSVLF